VAADLEAVEPGGSSHLSSVVCRPAPAGVARSRGRRCAPLQPADTLIGVARLARPEFLIEVDAIAVK
jgi:enamine deaminase RidA (YjgF/YER057c/UK114 family)